MAAISTSTTGSASPSLRPDSTFSNCRSRAGTSLRPTIAEANTGSVGARTAPTNSDVVQFSPTRKCVTTAMPTNASGMPRPSARAGLRHAPRSAGKETCMPSVNRTVNSARSAVMTTIGSSGAMWISPRKPSLTSAPASRNSSEVDRTVRAASPETRTATSSATPKTAMSTIQAPGEEEMCPLFADQASRHSTPDFIRLLRFPDGLLTACRVSRHAASHPEASGGFVAVVEGTIQPKTP